MRRGRVLAISTLVAAAASAALGFVGLGYSDVAATTPHWPVTRWILSTAMKRSVARHARGVSVPSDLGDELRVRRGAPAYDAMCAECHGAPGAERGVVGKGLNPEPPKLAEVAAQWSPAELFWITSHGVRMTGMPAFAPTHDDDEIWDVVALVQRLPRQSGDEYRALVEQGAEFHAHSHEHAGHHHDE